MKPETYRAIALHAGANLARHVFEPLTLGIDELPSDVGGVVYVVEDRKGRTRYVGSAWRSSGRGALDGRFRMHLREGWKSGYWDRVYYFPLKVGTSLDAVRRFEGLAARDLEPTDSSHHPQTWRRSVRS